VQSVSHCKVLVGNIWDLLCKCDPFQHVKVINETIIFNFLNSQCENNLLLYATNLRDSVKNVLNWCRCSEVVVTYDDADLQGQLTQAEQHAAQYKTIADSVECSLREQTEASEQFRQTLEARIAETLQGTLQWFAVLAPFQLSLLCISFWSFPNMSRWKWSSNLWLHATVTW